MNHPQSRSWLEASFVYLKPPVIAMLFLGFSAGLPFLLVFSTLTAWLRDVNVEVAAIGFFSWIGMLYSIKFFWAPVVDRLPLPGLSRVLGQRRSWMLLAQATIAAGLVGLAHVDPTASLAAVAGFALLVAFGSATQDIVIDAFRIESAAEDVQAAMASTYIIGYRGGLLAAGAATGTLGYLVLGARSTATSGTIHADVCSQCHPFYTGKQKILDTGGRVARFEARYAKKQDAKK